MRRRRSSNASSANSTWKGRISVASSAVALIRTPLSYVVGGAISGRTFSPGHGHDWALARSEHAADLKREVQTRWLLSPTRAARSFFSWPHHHLLLPSDRDASNATLAYRPDWRTHWRAP